MKKFLFLAVATFAFPLCATAQVNNPTSNGTGSTMASPSATMASASKHLSMQDTDFIKMASIAGLAEVNDGQLAQTMGSASVKALGAQMVTDHGKANAELTNIAKEDGAMPPITVDTAHAETNAKLKTLSGSAFDDEYLQTELVGHEKTIALFKVEARSGNSENLKSFASTTLPILEEHLSMIKTAMK